MIDVYRFCRLVLTVDQIIALNPWGRGIPEVERILVDAVRQGKVNQKIDGESLVGFFRQIGLNVRLNTQIRFSEHGELKTLEQKLKSGE